MASLYKSTFFFLYLLLASCLCNYAYSENPKELAEAYLDEDIHWLQQAALQNKQTDIRLRQASSSLIQSIAIWQQDGQLLFPERETSTRIYDYLFLNNQQRIEKLLASASPTAWEQHDINAEALFYCKRDIVSVCLLLNTQELLTRLTLSKEILLPALFSSDNKIVRWLAFAFCTLFFLLLPFIRYRFLKQKAASLQAENNPTFKMGDMVINPQRMSISRGEMTVNISERDLKILTCLFQHPDEVVTKDKLYNAGWGRAYIPNSRSLEQHIMTLRKKIDPERERASLIETVHGIGYRYPASQL